ncbi:exosome complex exonuclease Rrp6p [Monosporozyma unispora]|nr:exosome nuclease subunit [Kazachstania unispora]
MSGDQDNNDFKELLTKVVGTVRASSALAAQDVEFYGSLDKDIARSVEGLSDELLDMINSIILSIDEHASPIEPGKDQLEGPGWKDYTNFIDNLFEKSDRSIDILNNVRTNQQSGSQFQYLDDMTGAENAGGDRSDKRILKPQLNFKTPVDNSESHPFKPLLTSKPHALKPFEEVMKVIDETDDVPMHYPQPYEYEIDHQDYNDDILLVKEPIQTKPWNDTEAIWIDKPEQVPDLVKDLAKYKELAIDLEHHDFRTYYGIVCLMQISTRDQDYIVDTIALREDLQPLNEVFTDPMVTKVFHGAFMDIIWLQRDLGLYMVSLFDTFHASKALGFPKHSLAYLLQTLANFKTSKKYQLSDWRRRPLSKPLLAYARADTHFLLNIFDQLRNKLIKDNKLATVLKDSREVAKRRFEYSKYRPKINSPNVYNPIDKENPWRTLMYQYNVPLEKEELVEELYNWRDTMARKDDESPRYIMPNQLLISLVAYTPIDANGVVSVNSFITDTVRSNSKQIANLIKSYLDRMKQNGKSISVVVPPVTNGQSGESAIITLSQIKNMAVRYNDLIDKFASQSKGKDNSTITSMEKSKFLGPLLGNDHILHYDDKPRIISKKEIETRSETFIKRMDEFNNIEYTIPAPKEEIPVVSSVLESNIEVHQVGNVHVQPEEKEDMSEVVVLKKVKRDFTKTNKNKSKSNQVDNSDGDEEDLPQIIDYSKEDKVLDSKKATNQSTGRKRKFDPFSQIQEGVRGAKKRRGGTKGKNVSFKR